MSLILLVCGSIVLGIGYGPCVFFAGCFISVGLVALRNGS
jgi:hypothetical protein